MKHGRDLWTKRWLLCVWSAWPTCPVNASWAQWVSQRLYSLERLYKLCLAGSKASLLNFWYSWHPCELSKLPPTHLSYLIVNLKWDWVIPSAFAWVIASSGTWVSLWLRISYYSWWLPPPRQLGAAVEVWHMLVLFVAGFNDFVRGLAPSPVKRRKVALVNYLCHWVTSLVGRFLWCLMCGWGSCNTS
jgi:hypothetical protein